MKKVFSASCEDGLRDLPFRTVVYHELFDRRSLARDQNLVQEHLGGRQEPHLEDEVGRRPRIIILPYVYGKSSI